MDIHVSKVKINDVVKAYAFHKRFSGTLLVAKGEEIIYHNSFGIADANSDRKNSNDSLYGIGSVSKQFTAVSIMLLEQQGKLSLDESIYSYFPELGIKLKGITIHHLLSMTSGIREDFSRSKTYNIDDVVFPKDYPIEIMDLVRYFGFLNIDFRAGSKFDYSNMNYILLAAIVSKVSGMCFEDFLKEKLWEPIGLKKTCFGSEQADIKYLSIPYLGIPLEYIEPEKWHDSWVIGAGGVFSNAKELYRWMLHLTKGSILDESRKDKLFKKHIREGTEHYAYGWQVSERNKKSYIYHGGGTLGYVSEIGFYPAEDIYIVLLTNHTHNLENINKSVSLNKKILNCVHSIISGVAYQELPVPISDSRIDISGDFTVGGFNYRLRGQDNIIEIEALGDSVSLLDIAYVQNRDEKTKRFEVAKYLAIAFGNGDFAKIKRKAQFMLRYIIPKRKLEQIWEDVTGDKGRFVKWNFYGIPNKRYASSYWVRLVYEKKEIGLRLSFDEKRKLMGMHIDQSFTYNGPKILEGMVIDNGKIFVDGFRFGYPDLTIEKDDEKWMFKTEFGKFALTFQKMNE